MTMHNEQIIVGNPGKLDPRFGVNGILNVPSGSGQVRGIVEDEQGAFVYVVWVSGECWLYRAFSEGGQDFQFGVDGVTKWAFAAEMESVPVQLIRQTDGKFLLIGGARTELQKSQMAITRFNRNGSPDRVFGNIVFPYPATGDFTTGLSSGSLLEDGKILVAQDYSMLDNSNVVYQAIVIRRLHIDGKVDLSFGGGRGCIEVRFKGQNSTYTSMSTFKDGSFLVGGNVSGFRDGRSTSKMSIARFFANGALDQRFAVAGYWEAETVGEGLMGKMITHEDNIICIGYEQLDSEFYAAMSRLTAKGVPDPVFNDGKTLLIDVPADIARWSVLFDAVAVQSDGNVVAGGDAGNTTTAFWLRVQDDGTLDVAFGNGGISNYDQPSILRDLIVQSGSQRIIAAINSGNSLKPQILGIQS